MALSFSPFDLSFLSFFALVPLLLYLDKPPASTRIIRGGAITATVFFGIHLSWLNAVGPFSWLAFPGYLAILFCHVCNFFFFVLSVVIVRNYLSIPFLYSAPFAWVVCERLRAYGDLAFPWSAFGYALTRFPFFLQFADLVGIYGVSFWLVAVNVLVFQAVKNYPTPTKFRSYLLLWLVVFGTVNLYNGFRWFRGIDRSSGYLEASVIQPNIPQRIKWDDRYSREILRKIFALNAAAARDAPQLIVWPETAIPYYIDERHKFTLTEMGELPPGNSYLLTGLLSSAYGSDGLPHFYNSAALFGPQGEMLERYKKIYLVGGSEKYPFREVVGFTRTFFPIQDITYGAMESGQDLIVFSIPGAKFSALICYESAFPQLARAFRLRGSDFFVNITNDAWFGKSLAPYQHASFLVLRAIENRAAVVRCANTGISGFIDPLGRWVQRTDLFTERIVSETIPLTQTLTFYTRFGDLIVYLSYGVMGAFAIAALLKKYSSRYSK